MFIAKRLYSVLKSILKMKEFNQIIKELYIIFAKKFDYLIIFVLNSDLRIWRVSLKDPDDSQYQGI
jgi:hypothetical protein